MKRGRAWNDDSSSSSSSSSSDGEREQDDDFGEELTETHPWGVRPWGNFHMDPSSSDCRVNMGMFFSLDDATLISILSFLSSRDLARAGQTCRAMAVFCDHDPMWRDLLLADCGGDWSWCGTFRDTYVARMFKAAPHRPFRVEGMYSDLLNKSWLCATARFNPSWLGPDTVPRESAKRLTLEDFVRRYEKPNRPVIITGGIDHWPIYRDLTKWLDSRKETQFKVGTVMMKLGSFLDYCDKAMDEDPLYLFDKKFAQTCPELEQMYSVPPYFVADRDLFRLLPENERPDYRWLIAGGPCSGSAFHIDPNGTAAWNAVLSGSKKWILAPKMTQIPGVYANAAFGEVATPVSAVEWFVDFYTQMKEQEVPVLEVVQRPGEIIYVPHGWFHIVLNLEKSVALTHNYVSQTNLRQVMRFLDEKPDQVSGVGEASKHTLGKRFREALRQHAPVILDELEKVEAKAREPSPWDAVKQGTTFSLFGQ